MFDRVLNTPLVLLVFLPLYYWWNKQGVATKHVLKHKYPFMCIKAMIILCYIELDSSYSNGCNFHMFGVATSKLPAYNEKTSNKKSKKILRCQTPFAEAHSEPSLICKMELSTKTVDGWKPIIIFDRSSLLVVSMKCLFNCFMTEVPIIEPK